MENHMGTVPQLLHQRVWCTRRSRPPLLHQQPHRYNHCRQHSGGAEQPEDVLPYPVVAAVFKDIRIIPLFPDLHQRRGILVVPQLNMDARNRDAGIVIVAALAEHILPQRQRPFVFAVVHGLHRFIHRPGKRGWCENRDVVFRPVGDHQTAAASGSMADGA